MKKIKLFIALLSLFTVIITAQQKKYISYEVKHGETLKSIADDYNISTKDLSNLNPSVSRRPVMGTIIIVPNKNYGNPVSTTVINEGNKQVANSSDLYVVQPKETLYGISKKFDISIEELQAANPQLVDGLKIGMGLKIPKQGNLETGSFDNYKMHTVVKDDTVYNLTKRYNISEADLYALNPVLKNGLKLGMELKIKPIETNKAAVENTKITSDEKIFGNGNSIIFEENLNFKKEIQLAIILPYQLNKLNDSLIDQSFAKNNLLNIAMDFHLGAKMAIDSLEEKGLKINVKYFDSENSEQKLQLLASRNQNFNSADLIIGPLFFDNADWLSTRVKTTVVAPLYSKKQDAVNRDNLIKTAPSALLNQQKLLAYLKANYNGENVVVVNDGLAETQSQLWQIVNSINKFEGINTVAVIKPEKGYINRSVFISKINSAAKNWVIILSDDNVTTSATINSLKSISNDVEIDLFALNKGKNFDTIDNTLLGKFNFTFPTSEFIDTDAAGVNEFYNAFKKKNNAFPSKYALRGFDVTYDALIRFASNGDFEDALISGQSIRVLSVFDYKKNTIGNLENNGLFLIRYNEDLTFTIVE